MQLGILLPGLFRERGAQQIDRLVFAVSFWRDGGQIGLYPLDIFLRLLRIARSQQTMQHIQMMAHIMLVNSGLTLRPAQSVHFGAGLLLLCQQPGIFQIGLHLPVCLHVIQRQEENVKQNDNRGQKLIQHLNSGIQRIGINGGGIVENVIRNGQTAEQPEGGGGACDGVIGRTDEVSPEQEKNGNDDDGIADFSQQGRAGDGGDSQIDAAGQLTAEVRRAGADHRHPQRALEHEKQNQHQRQVNQQRIQLLYRNNAQTEPAKTLRNQKYGTDGQNDPFLLPIIPTACDGDGEEQSVNQNQSVIEEGEYLIKRHGINPPAG